MKLKTIALGGAAAAGVFLPSVLSTTPASADVFININENSSCGAGTWHVGADDHSATTFVAIKDQCTNARFGVHALFVKFTYKDQGVEKVSTQPIVWNSHGTDQIHVYWPPIQGAKIKRVCWGFDVGDGYGFNVRENDGPYATKAGCDIP